MNRVLMALEQNARYCHFYNMDPTRAPHWSKVNKGKREMEKRRREEKEKNAGSLNTTGIN
jgi:hypothetical protein